MPRLRYLILDASVLLALAILGLPSLANAQDKCGAGKLKCAAGTVAALLKCHAKAVKNGVAAEDVCLQKARAKLINGAEPAKGCFAKLEAKGGCLTTDDAPSVASWSGAFVDAMVRELAPGYPTPIRNVCSAAKHACVAKKVKSLFACESKAAAKGIPIDPLCVAKARLKFEDSVKGCFAKAETKPPCLTTADVSVREIDVDEFVENTALVLAAAPTGTAIRMERSVVDGADNQVLTVTLFVHPSFVQGYLNVAIAPVGIAPDDSHWRVRNLLLSFDHAAHPTRVALPLSTPDASSTLRYDVHASVGTKALASLQDAPLVVTSGIGVTSVAGSTVCESQWAAGVICASSARTRASQSIREGRPRGATRVPSAAPKPPAVSPAEPSAVRAKLFRLMPIPPRGINCAAAATAAALEWLEKRRGLACLPTRGSDLANAVLSTMGGVQSPVAYQSKVNEFLRANGIPATTRSRLGQSSLYEFVELESEANRPVVVFLGVPQVGGGFARHAAVVAGYSFDDNGPRYLWLADGLDRDVSAQGAQGYEIGEQDGVLFLKNYRWAVNGTHVVENPGAVALLETNAVSLDVAALDAASGCWTGTLTPMGQGTLPLRLNLSQSAGAVSGSGCAEPPTSRIPFEVSGTIQCNRLAANIGAGVSLSALVVGTRMTGTGTAAADGSSPEFAFSLDRASASMCGIGCALCGNGSVDAGEECDDGGTAPGDRCSPDCKKTCIPQTQWTHWCQWTGDGSCSDHFYQDPFWGGGDFPTCEENQPCQNSLGCCSYPANADIGCRNYGRYTGHHFNNLPPEQLAQERHEFEVACNWDGGTYSPNPCPVIR